MATQTLNSNFVQITFYAVCHVPDGGSVSPSTSLKTSTLVVREIADYSAQRGLIKYRPAERALKQAIAIYHEWKVRPAVRRFGDLLLNVQRHNRVDLHTAYSPV